jgi:DUF4097 and DUF4098 domain-containing protein YvlB
MSEFPCSGPINLSVRLAAGAIDVVAEERDTATVTVEPYDATGGAAAETQVEMRGDTLIVRAPDTGRGRAWRHSARLRISIRVPTGSSAQVRAASAATNCQGEYGSASLSSASGSCAIERVTGDLTVDTASGDVRVGTVGGALRVGGASSRVTAGYVGGDARVNTASGDIGLDEAAGSVRVETASGAVTLGLVRRGEIRAEAVSGRVSVGVAAGTGVWLDVRTLSGQTSSDLHVGGEAPPTGHDLELRVRTVSGAIDIHRVPAAAAHQTTEEEPVR